MQSFLFNFAMLLKWQSSIKRFNHIWLWTSCGVRNLFKSFNINVIYYNIYILIWQNLNFFLSKKSYVDVVFVTNWQKMVTKINKLSSQHSHLISTPYLFNNINHTLIQMTNYTTWKIIIYIYYLCFLWRSKSNIIWWRH